MYNLITLYIVNQKIVMLGSKGRILNEVIRVEGGYVNDPQDSGKETNHGVTVAIARSAGYTGCMIDMPESVAFDIFSDMFWDSVRADDMLDLSEAVAREVVDTCVNMGPSRAGKFLQRSLNVLNKQASLYRDLKVDGAIGPSTLAALRGYLDNRDEATLVKALNCLQGAFYITLAERREKDERFVYGWFKARVIV